MLRVKVNLSGASMTTGVAIHHVDSGGVETVALAQDAADAVWNMWALLVGNMPLGLTAQVDSVVEGVTPSTGEITDELTIAPGALLSASTGGAYAAGVGGRIRWRTDAFRNSRRVVGTTFVVPLRAALYEDNGTLTSATVTALNTAASGYISALAADTLTPVVWSRPSSTGGTDGVANPISAQVIPDRVAWLTSRRT